MVQLLFGVVEKICICIPCAGDLKQVPTETVNVTLVEAAVNRTQELFWMDTSHIVVPSEAGVLASPAASGFPNTPPEFTPPLDAWVTGTSSLPSMLLGQSAVYAALVEELYPLFRSQILMALAHASLVVVCKHKPNVPFPHPNDQYRMKYVLPGIRPRVSI